MRSSNILTLNTRRSTVDPLNRETGEDLSEMEFGAVPQGANSIERNLVEKFRKEVMCNCIVSFWFVLAITVNLYILQAELKEIIKV